MLFGGVFPRAKSFLFRQTDQLWTVLPRNAAPAVRPDVVYEFRFGRASPVRSMLILYFAFGENVK